MKRLIDQGGLIEETANEKKLGKLKQHVMALHHILSHLEGCAHLPEILQKLYELREGLNKFEQGLLQTHLKCCISPLVNVPGEVAIAATRLSAKRHGALIVIEQEKKVDGYFSDGAPIDGVLNAMMLENLFYPGSPLHDGAVVIRKDRILNAGCILPLASQSKEIESLGLGTRHRAALGLSQLCDALIIVVSEEKGWISIALQGQLYPNLGTFALLQRLDHSTDKES